MSTFDTFYCFVSRGGGRSCGGCARGYGGGSDDGGGGDSGSGGGADGGVALPSRVLETSPKVRFWIQVSSRSTRSLDLQPLSIELTSS